MDRKLRENNLHLKEIQEEMRTEETPLVGVALSALLLNNLLGRRTYPPPFETAKGRDHPSHPLPAKPFPYSYSDFRGSNSCDHRL